MLKAVNSVKVLEDRAETALKDLIAQVPALDLYKTDLRDHEIWRSPAI